MAIFNTKKAFLDVQKGFFTEGVNLKSKNLKSKLLARFLSCRHVFSV